MTLPDGREAAVGPAGEIELTDHARRADVTPVQRRRTWRRFRRRRGAVLALCFLVVVAVAAIAAPLLAPHDPATQDVFHAFQGPSAGHWLGTDQYGRDILSRLIFGARTSMTVAFVVIVLALLVAVPIALLSGYRGGVVDQVVMRLTDAGLALPGVIMTLAIAAVLGPGLRTSVIALTIAFIPPLVRFVRGEALARSRETYIEASVVSGTPAWRILSKRLFPNVRSPLIVTLALLSGGVILSEAGLSYLGAGVQPPTSSWGNMLRQAYDSSLFSNQFQLIVPGLAIALTILSFNTVADGLRDAYGLAHLDRVAKQQRRGITAVEAVRAPVAEEAKDPGALLSVRELSVEFGPAGAGSRVVENVSFDIRPEEVVGLVGESGSGKTVTALSIMRLLASPPARIVSGSVRLDGRQLLGLNRAAMRRVRGAQVAMIFQDPMTALDPCYTIGALIADAYRAHHPNAGRRAVRRRAVELLDRVKIPAAERRVDQYPHELSGGMRQRAMLAVALSCHPKLLIADEPTTALDVTVQAQVLELLREIQQDTGMSVLFVTHDLGVVSEICDRVLVMYAGQIVEANSTVELFAQPQHPYSHALLGAMPQMGSRQQKLRVIPGRVPLADAMPAGCRFHPRCSFATPDCVATAPELLPTTGSHGHVRCIRADELALASHWARQGG